MMKTRTPDQVLDEIARDGIGREINLSSGLLTDMRKVNLKQMKTKRMLTAAIAFVLVVVVLVSIPSVAQAIGRLFGYVPGAGFVEENSTLRVLKAPITQQTENGTITIEQAVADSSHTIVTYRLEDLPDSGSETLDFTNYCRELPWLKLADGTILDPQTIGGNSWASGISRQLEYAALPTSDNTVVMGFNCIEGTVKNENTEKVELLLEFVAAPPELTVYPVVELPTTTPQLSETALPEESTSSSLPASLLLKKYVQTDQELILFGAIQTDATDFRLSYVDSSSVFLTDSSGEEIPLVEDTSLPDPDIQALSGQVWPLTFRVEGVYTAGEATLRVDEIWVSRDSTQTFSFDVGADPQPGQLFVIDQTLEDRGHTILIKEIMVTAAGDGLDISFEASEGVSNLLILDASHDLMGGGGGEVNTGITYRDSLPNGEITLVLASYDEKVTGLWQTTLDLPALNGENQPTPLPSACLTAATWASALANPTTMPQSLSGNLTLMDLLPPQYTYHVMSAQLDGAKAVDLAAGTNGSLSPDGKTVVYTVDDGLSLYSLETGESTPVPGTDKRDRGPVWSNDGNLIAFTRAPMSAVTGGGAGPYSLMLMNADGGKLRELLVDGEANYAQTWLPGQNVLIFTTKKSDGATIKSINVEKGEIKVLREVNYQNASVAISPDGTRIAFEAMLPGERYGVFVSNLDGSDEQLVANGDPIVVTVPTWSPDGQWLAMSVQDFSLDEIRATIALVNPVTCQIIPMMALHGYVTSWR